MKNTVQNVSKFAKVREVEVDGSWRKWKQRVRNKWNRSHTVLFLNGQRILINKEDYDKVCDFTWRIDKYTKYIVSSVAKLGKNDPVLIYMHRLIRNPRNIKGNQIHHANGNKLDNRKENLLVTSIELHHQIHSAKNKLGYKGINRRVCDYTGQISFGIASSLVKKAGIRTKRYHTKSEAAMAYDRLALAIYGRRAVTNKKLGYFKKGTK